MARCQLELSFRLSRMPASGCGFDWSPQHIQQISLPVNDPLNVVSWSQMTITLFSLIADGEIMLGA